MRWKVIVDAKVSRSELFFPLGRQNSGLRDFPTALPKHFLILNNFKQNVTTMSANKKQKLNYPAAAPRT